MKTSVPLESLVDPARPITYGIVLPGPDTPDGVPYVRVVDIKGGTILAEQLRRTTPEIAHSYRRSTLAEGDLVVSIRGHVGRTAVVPRAASGANLTQDTARVAIHAGAEPRFVRWFIESPAARHWMAQHTKGVAVTGINLGDLRKLPVPDVPLAEQRRIADILDKADAIRRKRKEAIALTEELLRSAFLEMFGDPVTNPKGWPVQGFEEVVRDATGGNPRLQQGEYEKQGKCPVIDQGAEFIGGWTSNEELVARVELPVVLFGDHTKALKWVEQPFVLGADGVKILVPREGLLSEYLYMACAMFQFPDVGYSRHFKFLKLWNVPVPPVERQRRFASLFGHIRAGLPARARAAGEAEDLFNSLVTRAFSGELAS